MKMNKLTCETCNDGHLIDVTRKKLRKSFKKRKKKLERNLKKEKQATSYSLIVTVFLLFVLRSNFEQADMQPH